ncbi:discoidin domain-containing protein [Prosthecobacter fluviatilis]|uniref:Discoidin domain-containing protein n=1 Tax=Prosthecobacter fluviatilis TaxID=445931 RepID=A0ABW0KRG7_9BACT
MVPSLKPALLILASFLGWLNPQLTTLDHRQHELQTALSKLPALPAPQPLEHAGFHSGLAPHADSVRWVQIDLGAEYPLDSVVVIPAMLGVVEAYGFPRRFRIDASNDPLFAESDTLLDHFSDNNAPSPAPWFVAGNGIKARHIRFTATTLAAQPHGTRRYIFCLGELLVFSQGRNAALHAQVLAPNSVETLPTWSPRHLVDGAYSLGLPVHPDETNGNGWHSGISTNAETTKWIQVDLGAPHAIDEIRLIPAHPRDYPERSGFGFPRRFKVEADGKTIFDATTTDFPNPADTPVAFSCPNLRCQTIRVTATHLWERSGDFVFALAELQAFDHGRNIVLNSTVTSSDDTITASWTRSGLIDARSSTGALLDESTWLSALSLRRQLTDELTALETQRNQALAIAYQRTTWLGGSVLGIAILSAWLAWLRSRRSRQQEMESLRHRISRDLHDEIGSHLGSIRLMSELALRDGPASDSMQEIHRLAGEAAESMRGIIWLVREGDLPPLSSLVEAMRQSAASLLKDIDWQLDAPNGNEPATASLEFHRQVFLLFREAVHNITRHAHAAKVRILVKWKAKHFHLRIEDDGCGFDSAAITAGNGLANLRHRATVLGGALHITGSPGHGTCITLEADFS